MGQDVAKFSAFMDRPRRFRSAMTPDASRKRKLPEEFLKPLRILAFFRIHLRVGSFEVSRTENSRSAMPRAGEEDHVQIVFLDKPVQMNVDERQSRARAPMSQQPILDVFRSQRLRED